MTRPDSSEPGPEILERSPGRWPSVLDRLPKLPGPPPRWLLLVAVAVLLAGGGLLAATSASGHGAAKRNTLSARPVVMPYICRQYIAQAVPSTGNFRVVLGDAAVPPGYLGPVRPSGEGSWAYSRQTWLLFRGSSPPVTISVPAGWRSRVAIFGQPAITVATVRIPSCPPRNVWYVYESAFYLRTRSACVPLQIQVGRRAATVWFGLGRRCPANLS